MYVLRFFSLGVLVPVFTPMQVCRSLATRLCDRDVVDLAAHIDSRRPGAQREAACCSARGHSYDVGQPSERSCCLRVGQHLMRRSRGRARLVRSALCVGSGSAWHRRGDLQPRRPREARERAARRHRLRGPCGHAPEQQRLAQAGLLTLTLACLPLPRPSDTSSPGARVVVMVNP